jgi:glycosyltransferase involved in cell wall biosynthesis
MLAFMKYGSRAASTRQRLLQYIPYLAEHGVEVEFLPLLDNAHLGRVAESRGPDPFSTAKAYATRIVQLFTPQRHDLLWVQYELFPYLPGLFERLARIGKVPIVYDFDDAVFHMYDSHSSPVVRLLLGNKLAPLLKAAAACVCGNAYLETFASRYCDNCVVVPTVVDTHLYKPAPSRSSAPIIVGWIGSPSTWKYVEPLLETITDTLRAHGAILRVIGAGPAARGLPGIEALDWSEEKEVADVQSMDIGIMPVPDTLWSRGKCGYKLIQYMACGLPVIASPIGVNTEIVTEGENGLFAVSPGEWEAALTRLILDARLRRSMGKAGRRRVEEAYSLSSQAPRLLEVLRSAAAG